MFGITLGQLKELMALRGKEFMEKLNSPEYGGVQGILEKLRVDENKGLSAHDKQDHVHRQTAYGKNEIPSRSTSFFTSPV